jgi:hypothetical protein
MIWYRTKKNFWRMNNRFAWYTLTLILYLREKGKKKCHARVNNSLSFLFAFFLRLKCITIFDVWRTLFTCLENVSVRSSIFTWISYQKREKQNNSKHRSTRTRTSFFSLGDFVAILVFFFSFFLACSFFFLLSCFFFWHYAICTQRPVFTYRWSKIRVI